MANRIIQPGELKIGQPLPGDAYDQRGKLLLRQGQVITSAAQIEKLAHRTLFADAAADASAGENAARASPLSLILTARSHLHALLAAPSSCDFTASVIRIMAMLRRACRENADVALASILMRRDGPYSVRHAVNVAIACQLAGTAVELEPAQLNATVAAALTMNIGMFELQQDLQALEGPLDEAQHAAVRNHCEHGVALLRGHGVDHPLWLEMVRDHHERPDGSGYPAGCRGEAISRPTRLLSLADVYCARVSGRDYRPPLQSTVALRWLFLNEGTVVDERMAAQFIRTLGVYPPGTGVRLRNGSIAVVTHRGVEGRSPKVSSITTQDGLRIGAPIRRRSDEPAHAISEVVNLDDLQLDMGMEALWGADAAS